MLTPQNGGPVGLGPFLHDAGGERRFGHSGGNRGFSCNFIGLLDHGQGAVVMTNIDSNGARLVGEVFGAIATVYGWPNYLAPEREAVKLEAKVLDRYVGRYSLGLLGVAEVARRDGSLVVSSGLGPEVEIFFDSETEFATELPDVTGRFVTDDDKVELVVNLGEQQLRARSATSGADPRAGARRPAVGRRPPGGPRRPNPRATPERGASSRATRSCRRRRARRAARGPAVRR